MTLLEQFLKTIPTSHVLFKLADRFAEHNKWRRALPPYNEPGTETPVPPLQVGRDIDKAVEVVRAVGAFKRSTEKAAHKPREVPDGKASGAYEYAVEYAVKIGGRYVYAGSWEPSWCVTENFTEAVELLRNALLESKNLAGSVPDGPVKGHENELIELGMKQHPRVRIVKRPVGSWKTVKLKQVARCHRIRGAQAQERLGHLPSGPL